jgi:hypothetical protein
MGCISQFGKLGLTSIGNSPEQAEEIHNRVIHVLDQETNNQINHYSLFSNYAFPIAEDTFGY